MSAAVASIKGKQIMSQSARLAIRAFKMREYPERHELTEKSFFARVEGRPNDEDLAIPLHIGWGRSDSNRWALANKGLALAKGSFVFRNELEHTVLESSQQGEETEGDRFAFFTRGLVDENGQFHNYFSTLNADSKWPAKLDKLVTFVNPESDTMDDLSRACMRELVRLKHLYLFDNRALGAAKFGRVHFDFVTNCKSTARVFSQLMSQVPASAAVACRKKQLALDLLHCSYRDAEIPQVDTYAAHTDRKICARGQFDPMEMMDLMTRLVSKQLMKRNAILCQGTVRLDARGKVTLVFGGSVPDYKDDQVQAAHHFVWGAEGVTRAWDGVYQQSDRTVYPLSAPVLYTQLKHPNRIVFAKTSGVKNAEEVKVAMEKSFLSGNAVEAQSFALFDKMVKDYKVDVQFES